MALRSIRILAALAIGAAVFYTPTVQAGNHSTNVWQQHHKEQFATDHIIVHKKDGTTEIQPVANGQSVRSALNQWKQQPEVDYTELDGRVHALGQQTSWGWTTIKAGDAATVGATGSGVIVAVVDTGIDYNHEDLVANRWVNSGETASDGLDNDGNGYVDDVYGYDFIGHAPANITPDEDPIDDNGHGTHVAGIIAATNNTIGARGVAPSAMIMPVKVLDANGWGYDYTVANGIRYAVDNGANIINLSLGSILASTTLKSAIDYAVNAGVVVIAAAGNEGTMTYPSYPAGYANVISVGASNEDGYRADYSNVGKVDIIAPGDDIYSTFLGDDYILFSGTSMASPQVAGVAALIRQQQGLTDPKAIRHVLETTTIDFGQSGPDFSSGYGMVNAAAAVGTLSTKAFLYTDNAWIKSDGSAAAVITVSVRNASGAAVINDTIAWATTKGTLAAASGITNANGEASVILTADDTDGLATITATPTNASATTLPVLIMSDIPQAESIGVTDLTSYSPVLSGGDVVLFWTWAMGYDHSNHDTVMAYVLKDSNGTTVISGSAPQDVVGQNYYNLVYLPQTRLVSKPVTLPTSLATGRYTLTTTLIDQATAETSSRSTSVWVGEYPEVLVVYNNGDSCSDTPVEGLDDGGMAVCSRTGHTITDTLQQLGYDTMLWDTTALGTPTETDLIQFPVVVWLDAGLTSPDTTILQAYLDAGGNLLLSSELVAETESYGLPADSDFLWNYLHAHYVTTLTEPESVSGVTGSDFANLQFDTNYYQPSGNGTHTSYYANELELNDADSATSLLTYAVGNSTTKVAALKVDTDTYRLAYFGFGIESINDGSGNATKSYLLNQMVDWLLGDAPTISEVDQRSIRNNQEQTLMLTGTNFSVTGTTQVKLGNTSLTSIVIQDRTTLTAVVPKKLKRGKYQLTVINPNGQQAIFSKKIRVRKGGAVIEQITPTFAANNTEHAVVIQGKNFQRRSQVFLGHYPLTKVQFNNHRQLTVTLPKDLAPKQYTLHIKNPHTKQQARYRSITVRFGFTNTLQVGDYSAAVQWLELRLKRLGLFEGTPDTAFDNTTKRAVLRYQHQEELAETGITDELTRYYLNIAEPTNTDDDISDADTDTDDNTNINTNTNSE